jgi:hypothetical protein
MITKSVTILLLHLLMIVVRKLKSENIIAERNITFSLTIN